MRLICSFNIIFAFIIPVLLRRFRQVNSRTGMPLRYGNRNDYVRWNTKTFFRSTRWSSSSLYHQAAVDEKNVCASEHI